MTKKIIPTQKDEDGREWQTHPEIAERLAIHHLTGDRTKNPETRPEIPAVTYGEVMDAIRKAPKQSALGEDDISSIILVSYHQAKPTTLWSICRDILRTGRHPQGWKKAIVVPIPKANKARYDQPKAGRSIHLLSVASKTLERVVLSSIQKDENDDADDTLGLTQFGSRQNTGTSDTMKLLLELKKKAKQEGDKTLIMIADVEEGFDKVNPEAFRHGWTKIKHGYIEWVYNWTQNRELQFRFKGKMDRTYTTNLVVPQGSPLSLYLFGAYFRDIMTGNEVDQEDQTLLMSYVDDVTICIRGKDESEIAMKGARTWQDLKTRSTNKGMDFAENKTKSWHTDRAHRWHIGTLTTNLRFRGYWLESKDDKNGNKGEDYRKHTQHWLTKANYTYNVLRALTQRTSEGLNTFACLRLLHSVTRTIGWYGLEFYIHITDKTREIDSFLYEATK